jgi:hypothetical protein
VPAQPTTLMPAGNTAEFGPQHALCSLQSDFPAGHRGTIPKDEHTVVSTALDVTRVRAILSSVLSEATVESLNRGPLDGDAALAILVTRRGGAFKKSPFGPGNAVAQVIVEDRGSTRSVELVAIRDTFADGWNRQRGAANAMAGLSAIGQTPNIKSGRNMVSAIVRALQAADPGTRQTRQP